ncbi:hypothetical protein FGG78_24585 [Thioclava sp. BHET1]|nr:hypothetical protein FGG78_24585 [Thioclava sp. BHET1]
MQREARDHSLDTLLDLHGQRYFMGDKGHRVQFDVAEVEVSPERPHGLKYSLTVHNPRGERIAGFDNAHPAPSGGKPGARKAEFDHKHRFKTVRPYDYHDAATLIEDFWQLAESVLREEGVEI